MDGREYLQEHQYIAGEREAEIRELHNPTDLPFDVTLEFTGADEADAEQAYQEYQFERLLESLEQEQ